MDVTVKFEVNRYRKVWMIRVYVYLRSTFSKCKKTPNQQICISAINSHLFFTVWPSNKVRSHTSGIRPVAGPLLVELALSRFPRVQASSGAALGTLRTQRTVELQTFWGQDPFTDSRDSCAQASCWLQNRVGKQVVILLKQECDSGLRGSELRITLLRITDILTPLRGLSAAGRDGTSQCCCFARSSSHPWTHSPGVSPHHPAWILLNLLFKIALQQPYKPTFLMALNRTK